MYGLSQVLRHHCEPHTHPGVLFAVECAIGSQDPIGARHLRAKELCGERRRLPIHGFEDAVQAVIEAAKESGVVNLIPEHARNSEPSEPEPLVVQAIARSTRNNPRTPQDAIDDVIGSVSQMKI